MTTKQMRYSGVYQTAFSASCQAILLEYLVNRESTSYFKILTHMSRKIIRQQVQEIRK